MPEQKTIEQPEPSLQDLFDAWQADVARNDDFLRPIDPMERPVSLEPEFAI